MSSSSATIVAKNSAWLIAQPLILNILSLFIVGLIARTLGRNDYGIFVFAFAYTTMFLPMTNMGLRALTVRTIAEDKNIAATFLGKMLLLRLIFAISTIALVYITLVLFSYPNNTIFFTMLASTSLLFSPLTSAFHDSFQAHESMRYVAVSQFFSGIFISTLSIMAMLLNMGLLELVIIYVSGSALTLAICIYYQWKHFTPPIISINKSFILSSIKKGFPFFIPMILNMINGRIGILFISKFQGNSMVATYGAATNLTDKLLVVPEGIGASIFPTISALSRNSHEQAVELFRRYSRYVLLLGLPIAVGTTALSDQIIELIYGSEYKDSSIVLSILIWGTFFLFLISIYGWTLNAMHKEKVGALVSIVTTPVFIALCYFLVKSNGVIGVAISVCIHYFLTLLLVYSLIHIYVTKRIFPRYFLFRSVIAVTFMYLAIDLSDNQNIFIRLVLAVLVYAICIPVLKLIDANEVQEIRNLIHNKLHI